MLSLIYAASENDVIGRDGDLPWHLPKDLKRFKALTLGHAILMGRKTWESIGRPLPKRRSIVISRDSAYRAEGAEVTQSLEQAIALAQTRRPGGNAESNEAPDREPEIFVIGGAEIFRAALPLAERIHLTRVHAQVDGDVLFPLDEEGWHLARDERHTADERHAYPFSFQLLERQPLERNPEVDPDSRP